MNLQWYPGHMTKAIRMMQENIKLIDIIIEVVDARIPAASRNPDIDELGKNKFRLIVLNKSDLADPRSPYPRSGITVQKADEVTDESIYISAKEPSSIEFLTEAIFRQLHGGNVEETFLIPYDKGSLTSWLMEHSVVLSTDYTDKGTLKSNAKVIYVTNDNKEII